MERAGPLTDAVDVMPIGDRLVVVHRPVAGHAAASVREGQLVMRTGPGACESPP